METLKKQNWGMIFSLLLWCTITLIRALHHSPWYDEAHAWLISQELSLTEIIRLMKIEGHTFLWYLCMMPFAKTNFMYPYSMLLLNWFFCFIAMLILWLKAPFNNWIKFLISFSFPFLALYPVIARCYSIGIMFLFGLAAMEKSKLRHPNWYSLLLILCANTSVMAAVGATVFVILFVKDIFIEKQSLKNYIWAALILLFGAGIFLFQLHGASNDIVWAHVPVSRAFFEKIIFANIFFKNILINILILLTLCIFYIIFYSFNKIVPCFFILSYIILFSVICVYSGNVWHHFFFYVYLIISYWLFMEKYEKDNIKLYKAFVVVFCVISCLYFFYRPGSNIMEFVWQDKSKVLLNKIINDKVFENSTLIITTFEQYSLVPYLKWSDNIKIVNYCSGKTANYDTVSFSRSDFCQAGTYNNFVLLKYQNLNKCYAENSYMFAYGGMEDAYYDKYSDSVIYVRKYKKLYGNMYLYKLEKFEEKQ